MDKLKNKIARLESTPWVSAVKSGLIAIIPVLMLGSAALVFEYFPIERYQTFIEQALGGRLFAFFDFIYRATFGMLSVYLTCSISFSYAQRKVSSLASLAPPITSLICFFIFSGAGLNSSSWDALGVKGVFVAIVSSLFATRLLIAFRAASARRAHGYAEDSDIEFNNSVSIILPAAAVVAIASLVDVAVTGLLHVDSLFDLFVGGANSIFIPLGRSFLSALLLVLISSIFWFFGIHGSDVLESVMQELFTPAIETNVALAAAGQPPTEIFTKQFFDVFILMGGCGTAVCLLLAVLLFSRRRRNRRLSRLAALPMLFNINELMIFGYPIIYNTTLFAPFILTPLFSFLTTYAAMRLGLVPLITAQVNWTAPVLLSGYMATGSPAGSALQLFNIVCGVFIYRPFVKAYDRRCEESALAMVAGLTDIKKNSESTLAPVTLTTLTNAYGSLARSMAADLKYAMETDALTLYYQPQYDVDRRCVGLEALLRWRHPAYGLIYPPLAIQLARETGILPRLEEHILLRAVSDGKVIRAETGYDGEISVNVSSATLLDEGYLELLRSLAGDGTVEPGWLCLETTEQTAMLADDESIRTMQLVKELGFRLAIDDFSMGHTSLTYLQASCFDIVKLDGALVKDMMRNTRSYDIIKTITALAGKLGFGVIAEFVETEEEVGMLKAAGCFIYQGYLFSPALDRDAIIKRLRAEQGAVLK